MRMSASLGAARAPAQQSALGRRHTRKAMLAPPLAAQAAPRASSMFSMIVEQHVRDGLLSQEEASRCSRDQLEFLIRKRTGQDLPTEEASAPAPSRAGSGNADAEQVRVQAYLDDGVLTPDEVSTCSQAQLEFLIRKRTGDSPAAPPQANVVPAPPRARSSSPSARANGWGSSQPASYPANPPPGGEEMSGEQLELLRDYLKAQEEQEALLQQQVDSLKREVEMLETEGGDPSVVPFYAPPLTDRTTAPNGAAQRPNGAAQRPAQQTALTTTPSEQQEGGGFSWAGVAAASVALVGLSAGLYLATPEDSMRGRPGSPPPKSAPAPARGGPVPFNGGQQAAAPAAAPTAALTAAPKADEAAVAAAATKAAATAKAAAEQAAKEQAAAVAAAKTATAGEQAAREQAVREATVKAEAAAKAAAVKAAAEQAAKAQAAAAAAKGEEKSAQKAAAEKVAAQLAADLQIKQAAAAKAKASSSGNEGGLSATGLVAGLALAAAGALALPQSRAAARELLNRLRGEQALVKSAQAKYEGLKRLVDTQAGDFSKLQEKLAVAQTEYVRSLANLRSTANELEGLFGRVSNSERQATALVSDLERFEGAGNKEAKQLKAEAARVASAVASQRVAVERALNNALKDL